MKKSLQDFFLGCKECVLENPRSFYGSFVLGPFKNSQSLTIANALRRTLLTEISNIAITHIEIDGVLHEYSTIEGVRESVLDILLNFKQIVLKTPYPLKKPVYGYLNVRGPGIIRVSDLKFPPNIKYVDPDQYIATLNENGKLSLKFTISDFCTQAKLNAKTNSVFQKNNISSFATSQNNFEQGRNEGQKRFYQSHGNVDDGKEFQKRWKFENKERKTNFLVSPFSISEKKNHLSISAGPKQVKTNSLWVHPTFNPILKVNYLIENLEPIQQSFQNQVINVEIWTNGSIHPRKALYLTFDFLKNIFNKFDDIKQVNSQFHQKFFESEETLNKILKNYEYDFGFYDILIRGGGSKQLKEVSDFPQIFETSTFSKLEVSKKNFLKKESIEKKEHIFSFEKTEFLSIEKLNLPIRITSLLIQNNLLTIQDLLNFPPKELQNFCGIGNFSLCLIQKKLKKMGFSLKTEKEI